MPSDDPGLRNEAGHGDQPGTGGLPGPLRRFADRFEEVRSAETFDMDQVGRVLVELAADEEFFGPLIEQLPAGSPGSRWLLGDDMLLVGREEYDPDQGTWRALAPGDPGRDNR